MLHTYNEWEFVSICYWYASIWCHDAAFFCIIISMVWAISLRVSQFGSGGGLCKLQTQTIVTTMLCKDPLVVIFRLGKCFKILWVHFDMMGVWPTVLGLPKEAYTSRVCTTQILRLMPQASLLSHMEFFSVKNLLSNPLIKSTRHSHKADPRPYGG